MKALLVLSVLLVSLFVAVNAQTYNQIPGNDAQRQDALYQAVRLARLWIKSRICTVVEFRDSDPLDNNTIVNWAGWLCGYFGGPVNTSELCRYYYQGARNNNDSLVIDNFASDYGGNHQLQFNTSNAQFDTVSHALAYALAAVTKTPGLANTVITDFNTNLKALVVKASVAGNACPSPQYTINWLTPTTVSTANVSDGDLVTWVWGDNNDHSVKSNTAGFTFPGMGGESFTLSRNTDCADASYTPGNPCVLEGLGNFSYTYQFFIPGGSALNLDYTCAVHANMVGNLVTNAPPPVTTGNPTTASTGNTGADGTGVDTAGDDTSLDSAASGIASWVSFL